MPKISRAAGPSIEPDLPAPEGPQTPVNRAVPTPADELRRRGKLGPYGKGDGDEPAVTDVGHGAAAYEEEDPPQEVFTERDGAEGPLVEPEDQGAEEAAPERPAPSASRAKWAAYAEKVSGEPVPDDVTKAQLVERYGEDSASS